MRQLRPNSLFTGGLAKMKEPRAPRGIMPTGSSILALGQQVPKIGGGPGAAPQGFIGGTTSLSEWYIYWALEQVRGPEGEVGRWDYQSSQQGGRHIVGGSVLDFLLYEDDYQIGIRIQTFYFHLASTDGSYKQSSDLEQKVRLQGGTDLYIVDVYEQNYIHDESGEAAKREVIRAMSLIEEYNPRSVGAVRA